jgi:hypothetical protein
VIGEQAVVRADLGRLERLGSGGTAVIYGVPDWEPRTFGAPDAEGLVYKEYKQHTRERAGPALLPGLRGLVQFRMERLTQIHRARWDARMVWPLRVVIDGHGTARGVIMPVVPRRFFQRFTPRSGPAYLRPREAETLFGDVSTMRRIGLPSISIDTRLRLIERVAECYGMMHYAGIIVGDISGRNLVYSPYAERPAVMAIDTDSSRVASTSAIFGNQPHTPEWEPPEVVRARREYGKNPSLGPPPALMAQSKHTDVYKFGLLAIRILDYGRQRASNRDPSAAIRILRSSIGPSAGELLLGTLANDPDDRPAMRDWYDVFHSSTGRASGHPDAAAGR